MTSFIPKLKFLAMTLVEILNLKYSSDLATLDPRAPAVRLWRQVGGSEFRWGQKSPTGSLCVFPQTGPSANSVCGAGKFTADGTVVL